MARAIASVRWRLIGACLVTLVFVGPGSAQPLDETWDPFSSVPWQIGPTQANIGGLATIHIPAGFRFTDSEGSKIFMELTENQSSGELITIMPTVESGQWWFVQFDYDPIGYVRDDESATLDPEAILTSIRETTARANQQGAKLGWSPLTILGWNQPPFYDLATNDLTWSLNARYDNVDQINHSVRLLGRQGVMNVDLVTDPQEYVFTLPVLRDLLTGYTFNSGQRYTEMVQGDKVAAIGLTALVAGGVGAVAVKSGLLARFWKFIVAGIVGLVGLLKSAFGSSSGRLERNLSDSQP